MLKMKTARFFLPVLLLAVSVRGAAVPQNSSRAAIENGLEIIRKSQLTDGALRMSSAGNAVRLIPYFSNFAAMALLAAHEQQANPQDVERVRRWLEWYVTHQEKDGTMFDYTGTVDSYASTGTRDSTDSYASTFLMVLWRYQQATGRPLPPDFLKAAAKALQAIEDVTQPDGLTITKPDYKIKYLMDNIEVYQGLVEGEKLFESAGLNREMNKSRKLAQGVAKKFPLFWSKADRTFAYAADMNNKLTGGFDKPYPHGLAQMFALAHCVPAPEGLWERVCEKFVPDNDGLPAERWLLAAERCGTEADIQKFRKLTQDALLGFTTQNIEIHRPAIAILALIDGSSRFPDVPFPESPAGKPVKSAEVNAPVISAGQEKTHGHSAVTPYAKLAADYDVVIAGAGTAGTMAAIQAAKLGARVLLLEETDWIGGQMAAAAVTSMDEGNELASAGVSRNDVRERGLYRDFYKRAVAHYDRIGLSVDTCYISANHFGTEPRVAQQILYDMIQEARSSRPDVVLDVSLISKVIKVKRDGNRVTGVDVELGIAGADGVRSIGSKILIDATEWGDILPLAGIPYRVGNWISTDHHSGDTKYPPVQSFTWTAVIRDYGQSPPKELTFSIPPDFLGTSDAAPATYESQVYQFRNAFDSVSPKTSTKPWSWERFIGYRGMPDSQHPNKPVKNDWAEVTRTHMNMASNDRHVTVRHVEDPAARLELEYELTMRSLQMLHYLRTDMKSPQKTWAVANDEGYDTPYNRYRTQLLIDTFDKDGVEEQGLSAFRNILVQMPVMAYARESRRMVAAHTLRAREIDRRTGPQEFAHAVAIADYGVDLHGADNPEVIELDLDQPDDVEAIGFAGNKVGPFQIPMECFYPEKVDGFLAAEKNIGQSRLVNGATRLQPSTMLIGQAAGAIAGVAIREKTDPRNIRPALVQQALLDAGDVLYAKKFRADRFAGVELYSDLWKSVQFALLYRVLETSDKNPVQAGWRADAGGFGQPGWHMNADGDLAFNAATGALIYTNDFFNGTNAAAFSDYKISATLRRDAGAGAVGLIARCTDRNNYFHARIFEKKLQIYEWVNGSGVLRETTSSGYVNGEPCTMVMTCKGSVIAVELLDKRGSVLSRLSYTKAAEKPGYAGIRAQPGSGNEVVYSAFRIESPDGQMLADTAFPEGLNVAEGRLTRAWLAKFLVRQRGLQTRPQYTGAFKDVLPSHPAAAFIEAAAAAGFMAGENGAFAPDRVVTRADLAVAVAKAYKLDLSTAPSKPFFSDVAASHPAFKEIQTFAAAGMADAVFNPGPGRQFKPNETVLVRDYLMLSKLIIVKGIRPGVL